MRVPLSQSFCVTARHTGTGRSTIFWDTDLEGFGLVCYDTGKKSFLIDYRLKGRRQRRVLGPMGTLTPHEARLLAKEFLAKATVGDNPFAKKDERGTTLKDFFDVYYTRHAEPKKKSGRVDRLVFKKYIETPFGRKHLTDISRRDLVGFHADVGRHSTYQANRCLSLISKLYSCASQWGYVPEGYPNPTQKIERFPEVMRDRWLTEAEMGRLMQVIEKYEGGPFIRAAVLITILTGFRKNEALSLRWDQVDLKRGEITLPDPKQGKPHYLPLPREATSILDALPQLRDNPHVFPGRRRGKHLVEIKKHWAQMKLRAKIPDVRMHDIRRTLGSWLAQSGESLHLIGSILGHSRPEVTAKVYARFAKENVRDALEEYASRVKKAGKKKSRPGSATGIRNRMATTSRELRPRKPSK